jgi:hypothetical protein
VSRFRKVDPKVWNDEKFRELSHGGQLAFFLLLTHPHMTALGGMRATVSGLASESGLPVEAFREVFAKGLAEHDEKACCVTLPKFIRYNRPESPNVVRGAWQEAADLIPECALKAAQIQRARDMADAFGEGFAKAFREVFGQPSRKTCPNPEPEPEPEQEPKPEPSSSLRSEEEEPAATLAREIPEEFARPIADTPLAPLLNGAATTKFWQRLSRMDREYPWLRVAHQLESLGSWLEDHPERRKKNLAAFVTTNLHRAIKEGLDQGKPEARRFANA